MKPHGPLFGEKEAQPASVRGLGHGEGSGSCPLSFVHGAGSCGDREGIAGLNGCCRDAGGAFLPLQLKGDQLELEGSPSGDPQRNPAVLLDWLGLAKGCCLLCGFIFHQRVVRSLLCPRQGAGGCGRGSSLVEERKRVIVSCCLLCRLLTDNLSVLVGF